LFHRHIALEVVLTSGGMDKLLVYAGLGVREVWLWEDDAFHLHALEGGAYRQVDGSALLPDLDSAQLTGFVRLGDQHEAARGYRDELRGATESRLAGAAVASRERPTSRGR
jgi:Uma2 family endonuclease